MGAREEQSAMADHAAALGAAGQLLATLYRFPFDDEKIAFFRDVSLDDGDPLLENPAYREGCQLVGQHFQAEDAEAAKQQASNDFHKLFVGPNKLLAPPWSSCYADEGTLFGPTAFAVEQVFREHGFAIPEGAREPSDHIAYELQFLAELHKRALAAWEAGDDDTAGCALAEASEFKRRYLDEWASPFLADVERFARYDAYRGVAALTRGYLQLEEDFLAQVCDDEKEVA